MKSPKRSKPAHGQVKAVIEADMPRVPKVRHGGLPSPNADHVAPPGWLSGGDRPATGKPTKKFTKRGR